MIDKTSGDSISLCKSGKLMSVHKSGLIVALLASITFSLPATAKTNKWVDDKGVTHYGDIVPPEYANKDRALLNKEGRVIKKQEVLTPEELRAKEEAEGKKRSDEEAALELKRRDKALINTYSNEKEINLARDRNLQQIEARLNSINSQIKAANANLIGLQKESNSLAKANKKAPASLQEDLQESRSRLAKLQQDMEKVTAEKTALELRYEADKARYKELTGQ